MSYRGDTRIFYKNVMSHKAYFWGLCVGVLCAWGAFGALVQMTTPQEGNIWLTIGFFTTLFGALAGTFAVLMVIAWTCCRDVHDADREKRRFMRAIRHGVLLAFGGVLCALAQWYGYLTWWTALFLYGIPVLYEVRVILVKRAF